MNRNYDFKWGIDDNGSSGLVCAEDFRGPRPFSEPETQAVRDFLLDHRQVKIALNLHAWGPLFIIPYNYDHSKSDSHLPDSARKFYNDLYNKAGVPRAYKKGNGATTIGYTANGEASDWMLHELGIYALSPELGIDSR